jgi:hypothetical protein
LCDPTSPKITRAKWTGDVAQAVDHLLCKQESQTPVPPKNREKKERKKSQPTWRQVASTLKLSSHEPASLRKREEQSREGSRDGDRLESPLCKHPDWGKESQKVDSETGCALQMVAKCTGCKIK